MQANRPSKHCPPFRVVRGWKSDLFGVGLLEGWFPERQRLEAQQAGEGGRKRNNAMLSAPLCVQCRAPPPPCPPPPLSATSCLEDERGLKEAWIREVIQQSAGGLAYCHTLRLIHKDLKDENIMLLQTLPCIWCASCCGRGRCSSTRTVTFIGHLVLGERKSANWEKPHVS